jgi:hypothetical protein
MAALACLDAESTGDLQHRKSDEVAVEDHAADRVLMEAQDSASPAGRGARSGGPGHGGLVEVGVLDGDPTKVFGRIWDIVVGPSGDVFVLDNLSLDLRWFTADGEFLGSAGRAGGGPGEFRSPMSVALRRDGLVEVLDMAHRRLSRFAPSERGLLLRSELTIPVFGMDFCEMRARYYVLANDSVGVVTVVDTLGTEVHRFGEPVGLVPPGLEPLRRILQEGFTRGALLCAEDLDMVVVLSAILGHVRAFSPDGLPLWSTSLSGFHRQRLAPSSDGSGFRYELDQGSGLASRAIFMSRVGTDEAVVTVEHRDVEGKVSQEWRWLDLVSGAESATTEATGRVFAGQAGGVTVEFSNEPYPRVTIRRGTFTPPTFPSP